MRHTKTQNKNLYVLTVVAVDHETKTVTFSMLPRPKVKK